MDDPAGDGIRAGWGWGQTRRVLSDITRVGLDLLLPPRCLTCDTPTARADGLCGGCWTGLRFITPPFCAVYGTPFNYDLGEGSVSARALSDPPAFGRARAAVLYSGPARDLVTGLKFSRRRELAPVMARLMMRPAAELLAPETLFVPVPLHSLRRIGRRFNQSADLARHLARMTDTAWDAGTLVRTKATRQQVGLQARARHLNVRNAFRVPEDRMGLLAGRPVVLIDDVLTTGATVSACARALLKAGAGRVDVLTFAMAVPGEADEDTDFDL